MQDYPAVITGNEEVSESAPSIQALVDFYRAFNGRDLQAMQQNWEQTAEASMSNPLGGIKHGWQEIEQVYQRIFNGPARVYVEYYDYSVQLSGGMFVAVGRERGYFERGDSKLELAIRTSRIYRQHKGLWLQLHHHGSIDVPLELTNYQQAVINSK